MENQQIVQTLRDMLPKTLPTEELTPFEYGVLAGQQMMVNKILVLTKSEDTDINIQKDR